MTPDARDRLLRLGLQQIPREGLERLLRHIDAKLPMVVGNIEVVAYTNGRAYG